MGETKTTLLHLTDLHFGDDLSKSLSVVDFSFNDIAKLIAETIITEHPCNRLMIALGGDITNKAAQKKYQYAHEFLGTLKSTLKGIELDYILCPGNHDIETESENWFGNFNVFSGEVTRTQNFIFTPSNTCVLYEKDNNSYVVINSLYHGNHKFGLIDTKSLEEKLKIAKHKAVVLTHHHLIPILKDDTSTTRNSYDMLRLCHNYGVELIIHGHIHSSFKISYGDADKKTDIVGCGATLPVIRTNYNNQFNIIELDGEGSDRISSYRIIYDSTESHKPRTIKTVL